MAKRGRNKASDSDELPKVKLTRESIKKAARIFRFIGPHKWKFALGMVALAGTAATALIFPKLMGELMGLIGRTDITSDMLLNAANTIGLQLLILFLVQSVFSFFRVLLFANVTENMLKGVREATYTRLIRMPMEFFSQRQVAELNSRISADISQIGDTFTTNIAEFLRQLTIVIGGIILICITSTSLAIIMLSIIPLLALLAVYFGRKIRVLSREVQDRIAQSNVIVGESLQGIANVKSFTNEKFEIARYSTNITEVVKLAMRGALARGAFFSFIIFCLFGAIVAIVWQAVKLKVDGHLAPEDMMSFLFYTIFVAASIGGLPEQYANLQRAVGATDRVMDLLDEPVEDIDLDHSKAKSARLAGEVTFENVSFFYPTRPDFQVLKDVSFRAREGETIAIVGPSGSGKSTIASMLLRFYDPQTGRILIDGKPAKDYQLSALRDQMAIVPQDVLLFGGTIRDNIAYGKPDATLEEIAEAARKANAYSFINSFPQKFDTIVGERGIQLSGGQRQRIAIARAVLKDPSILILDEATSSLDSESEHVVQEALDKLMVGRTSFVIAHRLSTIRNADRIIVIENGVVRETGTHEQLMLLEDGLYRSLNKLQYEWQS